METKQCVMKQKAYASCKDHIFLSSKCDSDRFN